jgi:hypothetical protein
MRVMLRSLETFIQRLKHPVRLPRIRIGTKPERITFTMATASNAESSPCPVTAR